MPNAATMTRTRMIDTGSPRKRRLVFTGAAASCGGWLKGVVGGYSWAGGGNVCGAGGAGGSCERSACGACWVGELWLGRGHKDGVCCGGPCGVVTRAVLAYSHEAAVEGFAC